MRFYLAMHIKLELGKTAANSSQDKLAANSSKLITSTSPEKFTKFYRSAAGAGILYSLVPSSHP
jgi:hypothetical protein